MKGLLIWVLSQVMNMAIKVAWLGDSQVSGMLIAGSLLLGFPLIFLFNCALTIATRKRIAPWRGVMLATLFMSLFTALFSLGTAFIVFGVDFSTCLVALPSVAATAISALLCNKAIRNHIKTIPE